MHDPSVVVFRVELPWRRSKTMPQFRRCLRLVTVWHEEPDGRDAGTVCKGMRGSGLSWHNLRWAVQHRHHLNISVEPYGRVRGWLFDRCDECGNRFFWKQARFGTWGGDKVWHDKCQSLGHVRSQLDDLTRYVQGDADETTRWRVEYRLRSLFSEAEAAALLGQEGGER